MTVKRIDTKDIETREITRLPFLGEEGPFIDQMTHTIQSEGKVGVTTLLFALAREWGAAGRHILYLTDEPEFLWQVRLGQFPPCENVNLVFTLGMDPEERDVGIDYLVYHAHEDVVIFDLEIVAIMEPGMNRIVMYYHLD